MHGQSTLGVKKQIEIDKPEEKFLLYFNGNEPAKEYNWLLDIQLYSEQFYADASSMLLNELGINQMHLREHIRSRQTFFAAKNRLNSLKRLITESDGDYRSIYQALRAAELLHHLRNEYHQGFYYDSVQEMYHAYTKTLYQFDQAYRQFNAHAFPVLDVQSQQNFYQRKVKHTLDYTKAKRVFVIISDALRYEVAQELTQRISDAEFATEYARYGVTIDLAFDDFF